MKIKTTRKVLMSAYFADIEMTQEETVARAYLSPGETSLDGYVEIGTCEIEMTLHSPDQVKANEVAALQRELEKTRAEFAQRVMQIEDQIAKRLAITNCVEVTA